MIEEKLSKEEEYEIVKKARSGDVLARNQLIMLHYGMAKYYASRYKEDIQDEIEQVAAEALVIASDYFDCDYVKDGDDSGRTYRFSSYADKIIRQKIAEFWINEKSVKIPENRIRKIKEMDAYINSFMLYNNGAEPSNEELSRVLHISVKLVTELKKDKQNANPVKLDSPIGDGDGSATIQEVIPAQNIYEPETKIIKKEIEVEIENIKKTISRKLDVLTEAEIIIFRLMNGLASGDKHAVIDIAEKLDDEDIVGIIHETSRKLRVMVSKAENNKIRFSLYKKNGKTEVGIHNDDQFISSLRSFCVDGFKFDHNDEFAFILLLENDCSKTCSLDQALDFFSTVTKEQISCMHLKYSERDIVKMLHATGKKLRELNSNHSNLYIYKEGCNTIVGTKKEKGVGSSLKTSSLQDLTVLSESEEVSMKLIMGSPQKEPSEIDDAIIHYCEAATAKKIMELYGRSRQKLKI